MIDFKKKIDPTKVLNSTHQLIRSELAKFVFYHRETELTHDDIDNFLNKIYSELNLKLEV